jgi:hypothetical protein
MNPADYPNWTLIGTPPPAETVISWYVGLDLGQVRDPSALAVVEKTMYLDVAKPPRYACRHLHRFPLETSYPAIVDAVGKLLWETTPAGNKSRLPDAALVVDATGVGMAVVDIFRERYGYLERLIPVTITGGLSASCGEDGSCHVPKKHLASVLQKLTQTRRLTVARELALADALTRELQTFKVKISATGHESFESWRERDHDDLVLALAIALWWAEIDAGPPEVPFGCLVPGQQRF